MAGVLVRLAALSAPQQVSEESRCGGMAVRNGNVVMGTRRMSQLDKWVSDEDDAAAEVQRRESAEMRFDAARSVGKWVPPANHPWRRYRDAALRKKNARPPR
jgi:hypothetical protein